MSKGLTIVSPCVETIRGKPGRWDFREPPGKNGSRLVRGLTADSTAG